MIVKFAQHSKGRGTAGRANSFKATAAYLLDHDRPEWTETRNLGTDNPYMAARVMQAVSMHADELKERAGVSRAGRKKLDGDVFHIVVSWPEGTHPDQAHQAEAVREMLKQLGLEKAQAVLAAHNDNGKSHVHAMVNLVNPEDGRLFALPFSKTRAQAWAAEYSQQNGDQTCPQRQANAERRAENRQQHEQAREAGAPSPALQITKDRASLTRAEYERMKAARDEFFARQAAERKELQAAHSQDWEAAKKAIADGKTAYARAFREEHAKAKAADRDANKPVWRDLLRKQEAERGEAALIAARTRHEAAQAAEIASKAARSAAAAERREGTLFGKIAHALGAKNAAEAAQIRDQAQRAAQETARRARAAQEAYDRLAAKQEAARKAAGATLAQATFDKARLAVDVGRVDLAPMKARHAAEVEALRERQNEERRAAGLKTYEPKAREQDNAKPAQDRPRDRERDRRDADRRADRDKAPTPFGQAVAGKVRDSETRARERDRAAERPTAAPSRGPEPQVMGKPPRPRFGPSLSQEQMERRRERQQQEKDRERDRTRDRDRDR